MNNIIKSLIATIALFGIPIIFIISLIYCPYIIVAFGIISAFLEVWHVMYLECESEDIFGGKNGKN